MSTLMSSVRPPANGEPAHQPGAPRWPGLDPLVLAALAAAVSAALFGALGIAMKWLWLAFAGVALASLLLGVAAGAARNRRPTARAAAPPPTNAGRPAPGVAPPRPPRLDGRPRDTWFRALGSAAAFVVGLFGLAITASATDITDGGRTLVRATGWPAIIVAFAALGFALAMGRTAEGRRRPDWAFLVIAVLLGGFTVFSLARRLDVILLFA